MGKLGMTATSVVNVGGVITVDYRGTRVIVIDTKKEEITLNSGGYRTPTTKARMNGATETFLGLDCGVHVFSQKKQWKVLTPTETLDFEDGMTFSYSLPPLESDTCPDACEEPASS